MTHTLQAKKNHNLPARPSSHTSQALQIGKALVSGRRLSLMLYARLFVRPAYSTVVAVSAFTPVGRGGQKPVAERFAYHAREFRRRRASVIVKRDHALLVATRGCAIVKAARLDRFLEYSF